MKKKQPFTLLEIMIVIFLIGLIGSIIGYNMKGSLDEGKAFKTEQAITKISDILEIEIAKGASIEEVKENPLPVLRRSGIVKDPKKLIKDGWGNPMHINVTDTGEVSVYSPKLNGYKQKKKNLTKYEDELDDQDE